MHLYTKRSIINGVTLAEVYIMYSCSSTRYGTYSYIVVAYIIVAFRFSLLFLTHGRYLARLQ